VGARQPARGARVAAREDAEFAAAADASRTYVFAVTAAGLVVASSAAAGGGFAAPEAVGAARPAPNTSLFAVTVDGAVHAFYTHADSSVHKLTLVGGEWQDSQVKETDDGTKKFNVSAAAAAEGGGYTLQWANDKREIFSLRPGGKVIKYGDITDEGAVKKTSEAQCWYYEEEIHIRRRWGW